MDTDLLLDELLTCRLDFLRPLAGTEFDLWRGCICCRRSITLCSLCFFDDCVIEAEPEPVLMPFLSRLLIDTLLRALFNGTRGPFTAFALRASETIGSLRPLDMTAFTCAREETLRLRDFFRSLIPLA